MEEGAKNAPGPAQSQFSKLVQQQQQTRNSIIFLGLFDSFIYWFIYLNFQIMTQWKSQLWELKKKQQQQ